MATLSLLSKKLKKSLLEILQLNSLDDVMKKDFEDIKIKNDKDRQKIRTYSISGAVRLFQKRFYTEEEIEKRRKRIDALKLP